MIVLPSSISRSSALPTPWPWCSGSTKRSARRVTPERSTMPPKPTVWPSSVVAITSRPLSRTWRTWSHANGSSGNGEGFSARLGRDHSATRSARGGLVIHRRHSVVKLHRTHSATVNPPRPPRSVSASASRIRLRPRNASRPPGAAPCSQAVRPSSTSASTPCAARNDSGRAPRRRTHRGELIERDLARDVLLPEGAQGRTTPVVAA